ncbi:MAG: ABC transporter substrate-binding protein [Fidelibacterota bacterium]
MRHALIVVIAGFILLSCGKNETEQNTASSNKWDIDVSQMNPNDNIGDWIILHELSDADKIHPFVSSGADATYIEQKIFQSLMRTDNKSLELVPWVAAEPPVITEDHLSYIYKLRKDVHFSDGVQLTGEDVIFSLKALKNPFSDDAPLRNYYQNLESAELVDGDLYTVKFNCSEAYFKHDLFIGELYIYPKHIYDPNGLMDGYSFDDIENILQKSIADEDFDFSNTPAYQFAEYFNSTEVGRNPVGSGPYKFVEWITDDRLVLERDPNYWGYAAGMKGQGYAARIVHKTVKDFDAALTGLKAGEIDAIRNLPQELFQNQTNSKKFTDNFEKELFYVPSYAYLGWNMENPLFENKMVRRAMTYLCDRQQIVETLYYGNAQIAKSSVYFKRPEYNDDIEPYPYDPESAKQMLKHEGWKDTDGDGILDKEIDGVRIPFRFTFLTNSGNNTRRQIGLIMSENLRKVGIDADVQTMEWAVFLDNVRDHRFDSIILGWVMPITDTDPYQIFHSSQAVGRGSNSVSFKNARADELIEMNRTEFDAEKRKAYIREFQEILHEEQPYTFLYVPTSNFVFHKRIHGVEVYPFRPGFDPQEWWVPTALHKYAK